VESGRYSNMTVALLIPEQTYMSEMYSLHASKNNTKDKITFLKRSFLFASWSMDHLVKMAYAMKKKEFMRGEQVSRAAHPAEEDQTRHFANQKTKKLSTANSPGRAGRTNLPFEEGQNKDQHHERGQAGE